MHTRRVPLGVLTNYDIFVLLVRAGPSQMILSSPIIRDRNVRVGLSDRMINTMSVWEFLLALLLYTARPERLTSRGGVWDNLYVGPKGLYETPQPRKRKGNDKGKKRDKKETKEASQS